MKAGLLFLTAILTVAIPAAAQRFCAPCKGTGYIECDKKKCKKLRCLYEGEHTCLAQLELECCMGMRRHPCMFCKRKVNEYTFEKERREAWLESLREERKKLQIHRILEVQTRNFQLYWDVKRIKVGQRVYNKNQGAHFYAGRLEKVLEAYKKWFGEPFHYPTQGTWEVWVTKDKKDEQRVSKTIIGGGATKLFGSTTSIYVTADPEGQDDFRHANIVHHTAHLIAQQGFPIGKALYPGWWTVGVARFLEIETFGETRCSCNGEVDGVLKQWQHGKWHGKVLSRVNREKAPKLADFCKKNLKQMNYREHAFAWSYVDYIAHAHAAKAGDVARGLTSGKPTSQVLREVLGMSLAQFHHAWAAWVRKTYAGKS